VRSEAARGLGVALSLRSVSKTFGDVNAVDAITLDIAPREFLTFLGPSGSGKTTTLNMIAGFVEPSAGQILLGGRDISRLPAHRRGIGMVFQHYALFPHMTVEQNVAYPLKQRKVRGGERARRVGKALQLVNLVGFANRRPAQLSGGQQQRVALARALVFRPSLLLMDEPLGALDRRLREVLQIEIKRIHRELGITFVYVTHDQDEALLLSDRIAVFDEGRIMQVGTAEELYERPRTRFVAEFVGDSNVLHGVVQPDGQAIRLGDGTEVRALESRGAAVGQAVTLVVRPERMRLLVAARAGDAYGNAVRGTVTAVRYLGSARRVEVRTDACGGILVREPVDRPSGAEPGDQVVACWRHEDGVVIGEGSPAPAAPEAALRAARDRDLIR